MLPIFFKGERIGTVAKFVGHKPSERWVAWALRSDPNVEIVARFRTRKEAMDWVVKIAIERKESA